MTQSDNLLYVADNLDILSGMDSETVDLIYLDPPFNSKRMYAAPIGSPAEMKADKKGKIAGFHDIWVWSEDVDIRLEQFIKDHNPLFNYIDVVGGIHGSGMMAYLTFMAQRLIEMHRVLKSTGSLYLHCDPTASHYLKHILDWVFGKNNLRNEIIWAYTGPGSPRMRQFNRKHDSIFWYNKGETWTFNKDAIRVPYKDPNQSLRKAFATTGKFTKQEIEANRESGKVLENWWTDIAVAVRSPKENTGYPTQKPLALLHRIIEASSNPGDLVMDPFCGCATTCVAAQNLHRRWIGIDVSEVAGDLVADRLSEEVAGQTKLFTNFKILHTAPVRKEWRFVNLNSAKLKRKIKMDLYRDQEHQCNGCGKSPGFENFDLDHIIPYGKNKRDGSLDYMQNLQLLCRNCNTTKGKNPMSYLISRLRHRNAMRELVTYT